MDLGFTSEQQQLRKSIREFCEAEIKPHVMEWDESQHFPVDVFRRLGKLGVLGAVFPEDLGGSGYSYVDYSIVMEEIARVDPRSRSVSLRTFRCVRIIFILPATTRRRNATSRSLPRANGSVAGR